MKKNHVQRNRKQKCCNLLKSNYTKRLDRKEKNSDRKLLPNPSSAKIKWSVP